MLEKLKELIELKLLILTKELQEIGERDARREWDISTGKAFNDLVCNYAISEEELLSISETVAKFVTITRFTNIDRYLFEDKELTDPIIKRREW